MNIAQFAISFHVLISEEDHCNQCMFQLKHKINRMSLIAIDIGAVNTAVRAENASTGERHFHSVFTPDTRGQWIFDLVPHFRSALMIGVEKQVSMNLTATKIMKTVLWFLLDFEKAGQLRTDCVWGYISPMKKSPTAKLCSFFPASCTDKFCSLSKSFHSLKTTKHWAVFLAGHSLMKRGERDSEIFTAKKKDDLADVVVYCEMMRQHGTEVITECTNTQVARMLKKDMEEVSKWTEARVMIAMM